VVSICQFLLLKKLSFRPQGFEPSQFLVKFRRTCNKLERLFASSKARVSLLLQKAPRPTQCLQRDRLGIPDVNKK
jgi:hypothetical protein